MAIEAALGILIGSGLGLIAMFLRPRARPAPLPEIPVEEPLFLVRGTRVVDATEAGRAILGDHADADWPALVRALRPIFPDMPDTPPDGPLRLASKTAIDPGLTLAPLEDTIRIGLAGQPPRLSTALTAERIRQHRTRLSSVTALAPYPIWQTGPRGEILWSNDRYRSLAGFAGRDTIFAFSPPERGQVRRDRLRVGACHPDLPE